MPVVPLIALLAAVTASSLRSGMVPRAPGYRARSLPRRSWPGIAAILCCLLAAAPSVRAQPYVVDKPVTVAYGPLAAEQGEVFAPVIPLGRIPGVIMIHGGGWMEGDRVSDAGLARLFASFGMVVFNIDYRLAKVNEPSTQWPAQLVDAQLAVRFLRNHADQYNIDPARIGAVGESAGAQIAVFLGTTAKTVPGEQATMYPGQRSDVSAVVDQFGPMDLSGMKLDATHYRALFGTSDPTPEMLNRTTPLPLINVRTAPVYIVHGDADQVVPIEQSRLLATALRAARGRPTLVQFQGGHAYANVPTDEVGRLFLDQAKWLETTLTR